MATAIRPRELIDLVHRFRQCVAGQFPNETGTTATRNTILRSKTYLRRDVVHGSDVKMLAQVDRLVR